MRGILYGVGVGPGDPELMTLKAVRLIKENDIITLTVRKTAKSDVAFKESAVGNIISIVPTDTNSLATGLYVYDVQLTTG